MARPTNGKVSETVKRLLALEAGQREVKTELAGVNAHLEVLTEYVKGQGRTLEAIKTLLEDTLALRPKLDDLDRRVAALESRGGRAS